MSDLWYEREKRKIDKKLAQALVSEYNRKPKAYQWDDEQIKRPNKCKHFAQTNDIITGKMYKPRKPKKTIPQRKSAISLFTEV